MHALLILTLFASPEFLAGASREVSHASSASRDTAAIGQVFIPRNIMTAGADFALVKWKTRTTSIRFGVFGMLELYGEDETNQFAPWVGGGGLMWRGLIGYSTALSFDDLAAGWWGERGASGPGGAFETTLSFRHESEHYTGSNEGGEGRADVAEVPHIGDFLMFDGAVRIPFGRLDLEARLQEKVFLNREDRAPYLHAPGADVVLRWRRWSALHPFSSTFAEYVFAGHGQPDHYLVRNLTGVIVPGRTGDIYVFGFADVGHRKGLLVFTEERKLGAGVRFAFE